MNGDDPLSEISTMQSKRVLVKHRGIRLLLLLALGFAVLGVAARGAELSERSAAARSEAATHARHMAWHRQQSAAFELDSLTGFVRLFGNIADQLAAGAGDDGDAVAQPVSRDVESPDNGLRQCNAASSTVYGTDRYLEHVAEER